MRMRRHVRVAAAGAFPVAVIVGSALLGAPSASAAKAPPGDNGDVKIREVDGKVSEEKHENANDPKVCDFLIEAFNYDPDTELIWDIVAGPGFKGDPVADGTFMVDDKGFGRSEIVDDLDDGQYKLNVTFDGQKSNDAKHKVFKVDCPDEAVEETPGGGGTSPETTGDMPDTTDETPETTGTPETTDTPETGEEPAAATPADEEAPQVEAVSEPEADGTGVGGVFEDPASDDSGEEAAGAVDAGGGGMSGPAALPAVLLGGSLLTLGALAARRARTRG